MERTWAVTTADLVLGTLLCISVVAVALVAGLHWLTAVGAGAIALVGPALARIDLAVRRLPNPLTLPVLGIGAAIAAAHALSGSWQGPLAALAGAIVLLVMNLAGGMGMGDVKLGSAVALALSATPAGVVGALTASFVLGGVVGLVALALGRRTLPFGPFLIAGMLAGVAAKCVF